MRPSATNPTTLTAVSSQTQSKPRRCGVGGEDCGQRGDLYPLVSRSAPRADYADADADADKARTRAKPTTPSSPSVSR